MSSGSDKINSSTEDSNDDSGPQYSAIQIEEGADTPRIAIYNEDNVDEWIEADSFSTFDLEVMR